MEPQGWPEVRKATRDCRQAALYWGGWWTLGKTADGSFVRYQRRPKVPGGVTPLLHMVYTEEGLKLERAYFGADKVVA